MWCSSKFGIKTDAKIDKISTIGAVNNDNADEIVTFVWNAVNNAVAPIVENRAPTNKGFIWVNETFNFLNPINGIMHKANNEAIKSPQNIKVKEFILFKAKPAKIFEEAWNNCWKIINSVAIDM